MIIGFFFLLSEVQILNMALPCRSIICIFYSLDWLVERVAKKEMKWTFSLVLLVYYFTKQFTLAFWVVDMWHCHWWNYKMDAETTAEQILRLARHRILWQGMKLRSSRKKVVQWPAKKAHDVFNTHKQAF